MLRTIILATIAAAVVTFLSATGGQTQTDANLGQRGNAAPKALAFPNNVNTIVQRDSFGVAQNIAYYDADSGLFIGPGTDPRTTIYANVPINLFRRHFCLDFEEAEGLDSRARFESTGSANGGPEMGVFRMQTGTTKGSRAELWLPNVSCPAYAGQRLYFYLRTHPAGNLRLSFGVRSAGGDESICFVRKDDGGEGGDYVACTADGNGGRTETDTGVGAARGGDLVRRLFCINVTQTEDGLNGLHGEVEFYVGSDGGVLERRVTQTATIPDVTRDGKTQHLLPFIRFQSTSEENQRVDVDVLYGVLVR